MDDAAFQAWLDRHGGEVGRKNNEKQIDGPPDPNTGVPSKVTSVDTTTITAKDGATITLRRNPAPLVGNAQQYEVVGEEPPKTSTTTSRTPEQQAVDAAAASKATEDERERAYHRAMGHGNLTHAEYEAKLDKDQQSANQALAQARADKNQERIAAAQEAQNQLARDRFQFDKDKANLPKVETETIVVNGTRYTRITKTAPSGEVTIENRDASGKPIEAIPGEGAATVGGPKMPEMVLGASTQALTRYHEALWADPSLTPATREKRFQEAVQAANIAQAEANAFEQRRATEQRERESQRNLDYNIATGKANFLQSGAQDALKFASSLKGTDLGGKVFAALLGLNLAILQASGIDSLTGKPAGDDRMTRLPQITPADMRSEASIDAKRNQIDQSITASLNRPTAAYGTPPAAPAAPAPAAAASATPAAPAPVPTPTPSQPASPPTVSDPRDAAGYQGYQPQPTATPATSTPPTPSVAAPPPADSAQLFEPRPGQTPVVPYGPMDYGQTVIPVAPSANDPGLPPTVRPTMLPEAGVTIPGTFTQPAQEPAQYGGNQDAQSMQPYQQFPAIASLMPTRAPASIDPQQFAESPAIRLNQIASKPPWMLTEDDFNFAKQNGMEDQFWTVPGRMA